MARINFDGVVPDFLLTQSNLWESWLSACVAAYQYRVGRIDYHFVDNESIQALNVSILNHDYPTDIITLDSSRSDRLKVEMWIGYEVIYQNAEYYEVDFEEELARVLIHGLLHCIGFDDKDEQTQLEMRRQEDKCLISRPK